MTDRAEQVKAMVGKRKLTNKLLASIADELGLNVISVYQYAHRGNTYIKRKDRPKDASDAIDARNMFRYTYNVRTGSIKDVMSLLNRDELQWLGKQTSPHSTVAELIAAIVKDAYAEENEG